MSVKDVRRSGDSDNQEERQTRGQADTDLHTPRGQKTHGFRNIQTGQNKIKKIYI